MDEQKHIDEKIKDRALKKTELADLGEDIASSARPTVIAFVDLADSTAMKENQKPDEWLGSVYEFLVRVSTIVRNSGGTVVKRIGDEILATFSSAVQSEDFLTVLSGDVFLSKFHYKVALDLGEAYFFRFGGRADDPYGTVVDRCARIAKMGVADTIVCSGKYFDSVQNGANVYYFLGSFPLKGLRDDCGVYCRPLVEIDSTTYSEPLLVTLNSESSRLDGFKQSGRTFEPQDVKSISSRNARPFLARELLNLPMCPFSIADFFQERKRSSRQDDFDELFRGYVVEWEVSFSKYRIGDDSISVSAYASPEKNQVLMTVTKSNLEALKLISPNQKLRIRGVLESIFLDMACLNYVDFAIISKQLTD